jgi:hypothetical protein
MIEKPPQGNGHALRIYLARLPHISPPQLMLDDKGQSGPASELKETDLLPYELMMQWTRGSFWIGLSVHEPALQ